MTNITMNEFLEFTTPSETLELETEQIDRALQFSQAAKNPQRQWSLYIQSLVLSSFEEWVKKRQPDLKLKTDNCSLSNPIHANFLDTICNLQVGDFKVCLIPTTSLSDSEISIPRAVLDLPEFAAHFYIVIGIDEELEMAAIRGFLSRDRAIQERDRTQPQLDWNYSIDIARFENNFNDLLLYLQCLDVEAIPLPDPIRANNLTQLKNQLESLLPQIQNQSLWQVLSWEQGVAVLTHPELLDWIYRVQTGTILSPSQHISDFLKIITQQATNASRWIQEFAQELTWEVINQPVLTPIMSVAQTKEFVQEWTWQIFSPPVPSPIRSVTETKEASDIFSEIQQNHNLKIPPDAGYAYQDLAFENGMRLYGVTWSIPDEESWSLLLVLGAIPGQALPSKIQWRISDQTGILIEESLQSGNENEYLFAKLVGTYEEKFLLTLISATGEELTLPPLEFSSNS
ncbi:DUF1822 family protein [Lusitaniella coriacea]|uniref:DUF1822 family protein n=1 Tax=Lusitaniella coriacea TaxID=1983105 RepID=UPI003CF16084